MAILTEDALLTMPPLPDRYVGRDAIAAFLAFGPARGRLDRFRLVPTRANRQPAVAAYQQLDDEGAFHAHMLIVLALEGQAIASLTRFGDLSLFAPFGLRENLTSLCNGSASLTESLNLSCGKLLPSHDDGARRLLMPVHSAATLDAVNASRALLNSPASSMLMLAPSGGKTRT